MTREKDRRQWIAVTVDFFEHPKTLALSDAAQLHILRLWAYSAQYRTDGLIPEAMLKARGPKVARELRAAGYIEEREDGSLWCHDYLRHQSSREEIEESTRAARQGQSLGGMKGMHTRHHVRKGVFNPDCPLCAEPSADPGEEA